MPRGASITELSARGLLIALATIALPGCRMFSQGENMHGVKLYQMGQHDAARERFQYAIDRDPTNPDSYYNLAATHHQLWKARGQQADAQAADMLYRQCLQRDPEHGECYRGLSVLIAERGDTDAAFRLLTDWAARSARPAEAKLQLARLYADYGDTKEARNRLSEALQFDPRNHAALRELAKLQEAGGDARQALLNYQRSLQVEPNQPEISQRVAALTAAIGGQPAVGPWAPTPTPVIAHHDTRPARY